MDKLKFLQIVQNTEMLSPALRADLTDIAENYPYFQGVYALLSKLNKNDEAISQAAIRTTNRDVLKDFLYAEGKKKDKRAVIANLDFHTGQINAFEKFENLEEAIENKELEEEQELILSGSDDFEEETLIAEEVKEEIEDTPDEIFIEELEESVQNNEINQEDTSLESQDPSFPVFEEPDYLKTEEEISNEEIKQEDTSKELSDYKENTEGSFFDDISEEQFIEVNFEEKEIKSTSFFEQIEKENYKEQAVEDKKDNSESRKITSNYGEEVQISTTNIPPTEFPEVDFEEIDEAELDQTEKIISNYGEEIQISTTNIPPTEFPEVDFEEVNGKDIQNKTTVVEKNELSYTDYHLVEGDVLPPNTKNPVKKSIKDKKDIEYGDYHLTPPQKEVKTIPTDVKKSEKAPEVEKKEKPTDNFFDSF